MRRIRVVSTVLALCAAATACNDSAGAGGGADDPPTSGESSVSSEPTTGESTTGEPASPDQAAGPLVEGATFSFRLPEGWVDLTKPGATSVEGGSPGEDNSDLVTVHPVRAQASVFKDVRDYAEAADAWGTFKLFVEKPRRMPFTQWAGKAAYHFTGDGSAAGYTEEFGVMWKDHVLIVGFDFDTNDQPKQWTPAARQAVIGSVEASWQWK